MLVLDFACICCCSCCCFSCCCTSSWFVWSDGMHARREGGREGWICVRICTARCVCTSSAAAAVSHSLSCSCSSSPFCFPPIFLTSLVSSRSRHFLRWDQFKSRQPPHSLSPLSGPPLLTHLLLLSCLSLSLSSFLSHLRAYTFILSLLKDGRRNPPSLPPSLSPSFSIL